MLDRIIRFSLRQPMLIAALAVLVMIVGAFEILRLPIDVFPDLNRPRVVVCMRPADKRCRRTLRLHAALPGAQHRSERSAAHP